MSEQYALAPEFASQPRFTVPSNRLLLRGINGLLRLQRRRFAWSEQVRVHSHSVRGKDGHVTSVFEIVPKDLSGRAPALIDYHGGGFFLTYAALHLACAERYALEGRCRVFFPDYRLSIGHPFPAGFDDCYETLSWLHANSAKLEIDPQRVALIGDSAGGALAAGVAQKAVDRSENPVCAQILIYPVTDHVVAVTGAAGHASLDEFFGPFLCRDCHMVPTAKSGASVPALVDSLNGPPTVQYYWNDVASHRLTVTRWATFNGQQPDQPIAFTNACGVCHGAILPNTSTP